MLKGRTAQEGLGKSSIAGFASMGGSRACLCSGASTLAYNAIAEREMFMSLIESKSQAEDWLAKRLGQEGPGFWTDREREELAGKLAQDYRPQGPEWRVKQWTQGPQETSVHVVTRGGTFGIHTSDHGEKAREKAEAIMRALNALDAEMRNKGRSV